MHTSLFYKKINVITFSDKYQKSINAKKKKKKSNLQLTADFICILINYYCLFTVTMTHE